MNRKTLFAALALSTTSVFAGDQLEPCINGEVSASGKFPTQEAEQQVRSQLEPQAATEHQRFGVAAAESPLAYPLT
jgi:hypothetical protein